MSDLDFKFSVGDEEFTFLHGGVTPTAVLPQEAKDPILSDVTHVTQKNPRVEFLKKLDKTKRITNV